MDIVLPDAVFPCRRITAWSEGHVRCIVSIFMGEAIGRSVKEAVIWLKPARIEPPDPGTIRGLPVHGGSSASPYYYSGEEGPRYICTIEPLVPHIDSFSRTEISPGQQITIRGSNFGYTKGFLWFRIGYKAYRTRIMFWNNEQIWMLLTDNLHELYEGEERPCEIEVINRAGNSDSAGLTFVPGTENPLIDLR